MPLFRCLNARLDLLGDLDVWLNHFTTILAASLVVATEELVLLFQATSRQKSFISQIYCIPCLSTVDTDFLL